MKTKYFISPTNRQRSKIAGFTLVEVLVALFVLSLGLLGLAMLQTVGLRFTNNSYSRTQATYLAYDIVERIRVNATEFKTGAYDIGNTTQANAAIAAYTSCIGSSCNCNASAGNCSAANMAKFDLGQWYKQIDALVPGAKDAAAYGTPRRATVERYDIPANPNKVRITLYWIEQDSAASGSGTSMQKQVWDLEIYPIPL